MLDLHTHADEVGWRCLRWSGTWLREPFTGVFEVIAIVVVVESTAKVISRWLKTKEGTTQKQVQELEQRIKILAAKQEIKDFQKRIGVLEEIFVTEDFDLQRKLRSALGSNVLTTLSRADNQSNPKENLP